MYTRTRLAYAAHRMLHIAFALAGVYVGVPVSHPSQVKPTVYTAEAGYVL